MFKFYCIIVFLRVIFMQKLLKKGRIGPGMIKGAIISLIMLTVFLSILPDLIIDSATSVSELSDAYAANTTVLGTGAASIGGNIDDWTGYFWVLGPFILIITIVLGVFVSGRRR